MKRNITIKDLARKLEISVSTVSRALRNAPDINAKTKEAVINLAKELDYEPNALAKSLVQSKTNIIGVIVPELDMQFFASAIRGIQEEAHKRGFNVLIAQSNEDYELEVENLTSMVASRLDGLIISLSRQTKDFSHFDKILRRNIPLVLFDRASKSIDSSKVLADDTEGAYAATEHLIEQGYKKIAHIGGPPNLDISKQRLKGFKDAMESNNMPISNDYIIHCNLSKEDATKKAKELLTSINPPDAIFAINDPVAIETIKVIKEIGLKIPFHIGIVGFNNEPLTDLICPKLSSVNIPSKKMGKHSAEILIDRIEGTNSRIITETLPCELVVRESSNRKAFLRKNKISV